MGEGLEGVPMTIERMLEIPVSIVPTDAIRAMRLIGESESRMGNESVSRLNFGSPLGDYCSNSKES